MTAVCGTMPTYDYECAKGHRFELFQKMTDEAVADCPECGAAATRKISGGAGFLFKGDGFYITDYRSDDYKKKASAEASSKESSKSKGDGDSKGGSKPSDGSSAGGDEKASSGS